MRIVKIDRKQPDNKTLDDLCRMMIEYDLQVSPMLPAANSDYYQKQVLHNVFSHIRNDYYLMYDDDIPVAYAKTFTHLIKDKHRIGLQYWNKDADHNDLLQFILSIFSELPDEVKIIEFWIGESQEQELTHLFSDVDLEMTYKEVETILDYSNIDKSEIIASSSELKEVAKSKGFEFVSIKNNKFKGINIFSESEFFEVVQSIWNDMPIEDSDWESEDVEDVKRFYKDLDGVYDKIKQEKLCIIVYDVSTSKPVAYTDVWVSDLAPQVVRQGDTGVIHDYRGNNLGYTLKMMMFEWLLESYPRCEYWVTYNAGSNDHMRRINHKMGYKDQVSFYNYVVDRNVFESLRDMI